MKRPPRYLKGLVGRWAQRLGFGHRYYPLDFQIVCYFSVELERVEEVLKRRGDPSFLRPYRVGAAQDRGVFYVTAMRCLGGSVDGLAFDELLWGIRVQPVQKKSYLPVSLVACGLRTSERDAQDFLRDRDDYAVIEPPCRPFELQAAPLRVAVSSPTGPVCTLDLGHTPLLEDRWALLPGPAEVFKPPTEEKDHWQRYEFVGLGLLQILRPRDLLGASFELHRPERGAGLFEDVLDPGQTLTAQPLEVYISRPLTDAVQLLSPSEPWPQE